MYSTFRFTLSFYFQVGDQIIRVNGYPVEDAVHQEVALLAKNQQVLVLKIRSNYSHSFPLFPFFFLILSTPEYTRTTYTDCSYFIVSGVGMIPVKE